MNTKNLRPVIRQEIMNFIIKRNDYDIITFSDLARNTARTNNVVAKYVAELESEDMLGEYVVFRQSEGIRKMVRKVK